MTSPSRVDRIASGVKAILEEISREELSAAPADETFSGLDSLLLTQAALAMTRQFKVKVKLKNLAESFPSCQQLADHLEGALPATAFPDTATPAPVTPASSPAQVRAMTAPSPKTPARAPSRAMEGSAEGSALVFRPVASGQQGSELEELVRARQAVMRRQLELPSGEQATFQAMTEANARTQTPQDVAVTVTPAAVAHQLEAEGEEIRHLALVESSPPQAQKRIQADVVDVPGGRGSLLRHPHVTAVAVPLRASFESGTSAAKSSA